MSDSEENIYHGKTRENKRKASALYQMAVISDASALLVAGLGVYLISPQAGLLMVIVIIIYAAIAGGLYIYNKPSIYTDMVSFTTQYGQIQKNLLKELAIPMSL